MSSLISILIIIACILLVLIVLIQNPKGGGLASGFGAANQLGGVRKTTDFLEKATWYLAIAIVVLSMASTPFHSSPTTQSYDEINPESIIPEENTLPTLPDFNNGGGLPTN